MNIVIIGSFPLSPLLIRGGVESSTFGLAKELARNNDITVIDFPRDGVFDHSEFVDSIHVFRFFLKGGRNRCSVARIPSILRILNDVKPDVCHIHGTSVFSYQLFLKLKKLKYPIILTVHGLMTIEAKNELLRSKSLHVLFKLLVQTYYERCLIGNCRKVIADTEYVRQHIFRLGLHHIPEVVVIPQGIDNKFYSFTQKEHSIFTALSVGSFSERKSHLELMDAFDILWKKNSKVRLIIAGCVTDDVYYHRMLDKKNILSSGYSISIFPDVDDGKLQQLYENASIFVLHSQEESQGIVFAEAMACGLPIVATDVGGIPWVVKNGENGLLAGFDDISGFAESMFRIMSEPLLYKFMSDNNRKESVKYSWSKIALSVIHEMKVLTE